MLYFANPVAIAIQPMREGRLGFIDTPAQGNTLPPDVRWCADNGCFGKGYPGDTGWLAWLRNHPGARELCVFATAPDVVGDAVATLRRSLPHLPKIRRLGYPAALVAQNGLEDAPVPWEAFDVLFLGGSAECRPCRYVRPVEEDKRKLCPHCGAKLAEWKLSFGALALVAEAKERDKWVHMGRVNSYKRLRLAQLMGCDSADGTYLVFKPSTNLPKLLGWLDVLAAA